MSSNNLVTSAHQVPCITDVCAPMLPTPIHLHDGVDTGNPSDSPTNVFSTFHEYNHLPLPAPTTERQSEHDRTFTIPSFSSSSPMGSSHGCNVSMPSNNEPRTTLQPHEFVSNNKKEKQQKNGLTTIYTQNAQGFWRHPRDPDSNIFVNKPPDLSKLEYLIGYMRQNDIGAWLVRETWEEGNKFDVDINGYHIFCHNTNRGENGCKHLFRGIAIILSPLFYDAWRAAG
jgi:hypothetical protein